MNSMNNLPNEQETLRDQYKIFIKEFNNIIQMIFTTIGNTNTKSTRINNHELNSKEGEITITREMVKIERYINKIIKMQIQHNINSKKIQNNYIILDNLNKIKFKKNLNYLFNMKMLLDKICLDGENERREFKKLNQLSLKPNEVMSYGRLIAPYTSAPPAPTKSDSGEKVIDGLDLQDPNLRFLMPFPTEDVIKRGRMGQYMFVHSMDTIHVEDSNRIGALVGEIRSADAVRPDVSSSQFNAYPTMNTRRAPPPPTLPESEDDLFDLDLNPDL